MERLELFEIVAIPRSPRQALEADDAAKGGDSGRVTADLDAQRPLRDRVVVERRQTAAHDVDDAVATADTKVIDIGYILIGEGFSVVEPAWDQ